MNLKHTLALKHLCFVPLRSCVLVTVLILTMQSLVGPRYQRGHRSLAANLAQSTSGGDAEGPSRDLGSKETTAPSHEEEDEDYDIREEVEEVIGTQPLIASCVPLLLQVYHYYVFPLCI